MTIRDAGGRAPQNAVHVWSNIPAVRRYALALWAAMRRAPAGGSSLPWPRCPGRAPPNPGTLRSGMPPPLRGPAPGCHTRAHEVLASGLCRLGRPSPGHVPWGCWPHPYGPAHGRRPRTLTRTRSHARGAPWPHGPLMPTARPRAFVRALPRPRPISAPARRPPPPDTSVAPVSACPVPTALGVAGCSPAPTPSTALCRQCRPSFCDSRVLCLPRGEPLQPFPAPRPRDRMWCS